MNIRRLDRALRVCRRALKEVKVTWTSRDENGIDEAELRLAKRSLDTLHVSSLSTAASRSSLPHEGSA